MHPVGVFFGLEQSLRLLLSGTESLRLQLVLILVSRTQLHQPDNSIKRKDQAGQLSLAIPPWVGAKMTNKTAFPSTQCIKHSVQCNALALYQ